MPPAARPPGGAWPPAGSSNSIPPGRVRLPWQKVAADRSLCSSALAVTDARSPLATLQPSCGQSRISPGRCRAPRRAKETPCGTTANLLIGQDYLQAVCVVARENSESVLHITRYPNRIGVRVSSRKLSVQLVCRDVIVERLASVQQIHANYARIPLLRIIKRRPHYVASHHARARIPGSAPRPHRQIHHRKTRRPAW